MRVLVNIAGFQLAWLASLYGASRGTPWLGPAVTATVLTLHLIIHRESLPAEARLIVTAAGLGYVMDSALVIAGLLDFPEVARLGAPSTLWMVMLWANFAATLRVALRWLAGRYLIAGLLGCVGGVLAYYAGSGFGALSLGSSSAVSLAAIGVEWAAATPILVWLAHRDRTRPRTAPVFAREAQS